MFGRLSVPFRGLNDDCGYDLTVAEYWSGGVGDTELEGLLVFCGKNASYISKNSQNKPTYCCGSAIL